ncbi:FecR family protein [Asticcacaulis sp.]|uniref:FecR family protein n=1 Tax=Asticcacaulis sp. TaxID=1872648 RepID=UPI00261AEA15|nr:FecR domain-containing protein [Asticcacaulis sp.]
MLPEPTVRRVPPLGTAAEAAVWMARLKSDNRLPETEAAFRRWLEITPDAQYLFDEATDVWEMLPSAIPARRARPASPAISRRMALAGAMAAAIVVVVGGGIYAVNLRPVVYETQKGEQRSVSLADTSKVTLNTDTKLSVRYSHNRRYVQLERGEAVFQVAHDPSRPFVVETRNQRVTALGTVFLVRSDPTEMQVALFSGKVELRAKQEVSAANGMILKPGERATVREGMTPVVDRPVSDVITAWQRQEIVFSDVTLGEAINELNRYSRQQIVITDSSIASLKVAGVFQTGDSAAFASNMARIYGLKVRQSDGVIALTR